MLDSIDDMPRFSCLDWWEKLQAGETPMADVPIDQDRAAEALAFFNQLRLPDVVGSPALQDACGEWFKDILVAFLASSDPITSKRIVWELLCMVPKKSSKTTYSAGLGLTALYLEETPNAQMLIVAPSQNISTRCFDQAQAMIRQDPDLNAIFQIIDHKKRIVRRKTGAKLDVKTFDTGIITGEIPVLTIIDELHELGKKKDAFGVMQQIRGGGITKTGGQILMITTQSDKEPTGVWKAELLKARKIRDGKAGNSSIMLPILYEFPQAVQKDEAFWRDMTNWHLVLPNLGFSIDVERLEADYQNNGSQSPEAEQIWISQHLNVEIGLGFHSNRWVAADYWDDCAIEGLTLTELIARCDVAVVGGDMGGADDLASLNVTGRCLETKARLTWSKAWCVSGVLERRQEIATKLLDLQQSGNLVIDDDTDLHVQEMADVCDQVRAAGIMPDKGGIGLDPWGVAALLDELRERGYDLEQIEGVGQGFRLNGAIKGIERRLLNGTMLHGGQPIMTWCMGNAKAEARGNNIMITKERAGVAKIDPLIAMFNSAQLMDQNPEAPSTKIDDFLSNPVMVI
ncbi:terminase TerL endonuclease subunit [Sulfitobacter sp.]|uniref:terminase TerL endonuclease subunit n=1 Tax=Sulfitobacter sp. TaxID=1903071 RepID=UPI0030037E78